MKSNSMKMEHIVAYINGMQFRKKLFGVNVEEVYEAMQQMDAMYQDAIEGYSIGLEDVFAEREETVEKNERKIQGLVRKASVAVESRKKDQEIIRELEKKLTYISREREEYQKQADLLAESISGTQKSREQIIQKAKEEAEHIIWRAKEESMYARASNRILQEQQSYAKHLERLTASKKEAKENLQLIRVDLHNLQELFSALQRETGVELNDVNGEEQEVPGWNQYKLESTNVV